MSFQRYNCFFFWLFIQFNSEFEIETDVSHEKLNCLIHTDETNYNFLVCFKACHSKSPNVFLGFFLVYQHIIQRESQLWPPKFLGLLMKPWSMFFRLLIFKNIQIQVFKKKYNINVMLNWIVTLYPLDLLNQIFLYAPPPLSLMASVSHGVKKKWIWLNIAFMVFAYIYPFKLH